MIKTFTVDTSNIEEMLKLRNTLSSMIGNAKREQTGAVSKRENIRKKYHAMRNILETDISHLWENDFLSTERKFYVYFHCDPTRTLKIQSGSCVCCFVKRPKCAILCGKRHGIPCL